MTRPAVGTDADTAWIVTPGEHGLQINLTRSRDGWEIDIHDETADHVAVTYNGKAVYEMSAGR